jgi:hypothetical protein
MQAKPGCFVPRSKNLDGIARDLASRRNVGHEVAVRTVESQLAVGPSLHLVTVLVHRTVVARAEQGEIRECGGATLGPVADVMALAEPEPAAREATAAVAVVEYPA